MPRKVLYTLARSALFQLDPEVAHHLALKSLAALGPGAALLGAGADRDEARTVMGIEFPNPVGLAAGLDKNGEYIDALAALGWKQSDFCRKTGVSKDTPSRWAGGKTPIQAWVPAYLGAMQDLADLHAKYLAPVKPASPD